VPRYLPGSIQLNPFSRSGALQAKRPFKTCALALVENGADMVADPLPIIRMQKGDEDGSSQWPAVTFNVGSAKHELTEGHVAVETISGGVKPPQGHRCSLRSERE
jgi:hypothetical protein